MTDSFDPYYTWLGIPPEEQPPNHYRLLGLRVFESNPVAIENAADQRMAYVRTFSGKLLSHSQKLLNEVSLARVCLLDALAKAKYDSELQERLNGAKKAAIASPTAPAAAESTSAVSSVVSAAIHDDAESPLFDFDSTPLDMRPTTSAAERDVIDQALDVDEKPEEESRSLLIRQQKAVLRDLTQVIAARAAAVAKAEADFATRQQLAEEEFERNTQRVETEYRNARQNIERAYQDGCRTVSGRFEPENRATEQEYRAVKQRVTNQYEAEKNKAKKELHEAKWETQTVFDATKHKPRRELAEAEKQVNARAERIGAIAQEAKDLLFDCRLYREPPARPEGEAEGESPPPFDDPLKSFIDLIASADTQLERLKALGLPRFFRGGTPVWMFIGVGAVFVLIAGGVSEWNIAAMAVAGGVSIVLSAIAVAWLYIMARGSVQQIFDPMCQMLTDAQRAQQQWHEQATAKCQREQAEIKHRHETELARATEKYDKAKAEIKERRDKQSRSIEEKYPPKLAELKQRHDADLREITARHQQQLAEAARKHETQVRETQEQHQKRLAQIKTEHENDWTQLAAAWRAGLQKIKAEAEEVMRDTQRPSPAWDDPRWDKWTPPTELTSAIPFGQFEVRLDQIPGGMSEDPRLTADIPTSFTLPALVPFPQRASLLFRAAGGGRVKSIDAIQAVMLRFLTMIPAGKVRFTIIDPVGLGQNFAGFMHLADYDELLVTNKIWTEPTQIEQRLSDLTAHMSNVIQKYLRNEFETIEDYNKHAGEVAEPFRVLVIANFPFGFTDTAIRHLMAIAGTGMRCGVFTLIGVDAKLPVPHGFAMSDLEQFGTKLLWRDQNFVWKNPAYEKFQLKLDSPPSPERFTRVVNVVGDAAKNSNRVEVPFEFIAPEPNEYWTGSTAKSVDVALGRAGATKRQYLRLGRGTAQHVLIAGKTGSGKSTLLHALITNLALMYSPDEVELYLIDFKKGVEFKTYAQWELPHARIIAIESEREFGLSVLQRLDAELKYRGDKFRDLAVQDLNAYRQANPGARMPRILLLVDEFQEFFVEDDKIAQDVSLLLDRLVRQGRAFGIHIHLGSQTLGGAYSLARSTLGQMAVRIALQCSEADANLILSEENSAARLLTRPGEAIYNDANGRVEGNNLFQVVWLSDDRHEEYLRTIHEMATERKVSLGPQIVFEGNIPADLNKNYLLEKALREPAEQLTTSAKHAWLGDAIAIKDPTVADFRHQSGSNLVILGQQSESALAMIVAMQVALAAQNRVTAAGPSAKFYVLDGQPPDAPHASVLPKMQKIIPNPLDFGGPRDVTRIIGEVADEVTRRQAAHDADAPNIYLFIYDLQRFRDLRRQEDDFSFGRGEEKPSPSKQLATILREGPGLGVHTIVWCDTLNNLQRSFDRQTTREFETRVLFQMSVSDSSTLIDSPMASKLGPHRALLHSEEQGRLEKFRPYRLPDDAWLATVAQQLKPPQSNGQAKDHAKPLETDAV